jgi:signal peptidase I
MLKKTKAILIVILVLAPLIAGIFWLTGCLALIAGIIWFANSNLGFIRYINRHVWLYAPIGLVGVVLLAVWMRVFVLEIYAIPSGSMEDTLLAGDKVIVFKPAYGPALPRSPFELPWLNLFFVLSESAKERFNDDWWPHRRLRGYTKLTNNDVLVFRFPGNRDEFFIKRCVAIPGDTLLIISDSVFINGKLLPHPAGVKHNPFYQHRNSFVSGEAASGPPQVFPYSEHFRWDIGNFGPLLLPKPGQIVELSEPQVAIYWNLMANTEGLTPENRNGHYLVGGLPAKTYRFAHGYCFMLGDNRHKSNDSRYFGPIPEQHISGKATLVLFNFHNGRFDHRRWLKRIY